MIKISAVIPAYNASQVICNAIDSVIAQTYPVVDVCVVDDGSSDDTYQKVTTQYAGVVKVIKQTNAGPAAARNRGIKESKGDWIALLDSDDAWLPNKLEEQVRYMTDANIGIVHCLATDATCDNTPVNFDTLWQRNRITASSAVIRRAAIDEVGGFDEDRALISVEDYNLWLRIAAAGWKVHTCQERLLYYSRAPGSLSTQIERFARAEFVNLTKIAKMLRLPDIMVRKKTISIAEEYGRSLFYMHQFNSARRLLAPPLQMEPTFHRLVWWLATYIAPPIYAFKCAGKHT